MSTRDPITCHVLNTLTGKPGSGLSCTLTLLSPRPSSSTSNPPTFHSTTNSDGRIISWTPSSTPSSSSASSLSSTLASLPSPSTKSTWSIRFDVGPWYEAQYVESFWPEVEVKFVVQGRGIEGEEGWRHYHVPVLMGPYSYTTYRGS